MRKKIIKTMFIICLGALCAMPSFAQAEVLLELLGLGEKLPVEDKNLEASSNIQYVQMITNWLTAIDTLYATYDMITNTVTQIENQYKQIQKAVERAKNIDWENISFDGDFDIRNDIRDANKRVNKLLTQARTIKNSLTTNVIRLPGGVGYSIADLCGMGSNESKDIFTAAADVYGYMSNNMKEAADAVMNGVTPIQGAAIMAKYGISPRNYWFVKQTENQLNTAIQNALAYACDVAEKMTEETEDAEKRSVIIKAAEATIDSEGNMPEGATSEAIMRLLAMQSEQLSGLKTALREVAGLSANKIMQEQAEKEAKASSNAEQKELQSNMSSDVPGYFVKDPKAID